MSAFIETIFGPRFVPSFLELRTIRGAEVQSTFYDADEYDLGVDLAIKWDRDGWDVYYGVLPRFQYRGRDEDCSSETYVLWQDIDLKHIEGDHMAALMSLQRSGLDPSILVDSGNGLHAYHLLSAPVPFDRARAVMKGMAKVVGGDHTYNASRVLRLPGTRNHKTDPPKPVRILHFDPDRRYRISDFDLFIEPESAPNRNNMPRYGEKHDWHELPGWLVDLIETGAPKGQRSEACFKAVLWLLRYGWNHNDIYELFLRTPEGIGAKFAEKKLSGPSWFHTTYKAAEAAA